MLLSIPAGHTSWPYPGKLDALYHIATCHVVLTEVSPSQVGYLLPAADDT